MRTKPEYRIGLFFQFSSERHAAGWSVSAGPPIGVDPVPQGALLGARRRGVERGQVLLVARVVAVDELAHLLGVHSPLAARAPLLLGLLPPRVDGPRADRLDHNEGVELRVGLVRVRVGFGFGLGLGLGLGLGG